MAELDLDALRAQREAARREANKDTPKITIGGEHFELPVELPLDLAWSIEEGKFSNRDIARALLGEVAFEKFLATKPTNEDWRAVDEWLGSVYFPSSQPKGPKGAGEEKASGDS